MNLAWSDKYGGYLDGDGNVLSPAQAQSAGYFLIGGPADSAKAAAAATVPTVTTPAGTFAATSPEAQAYSAPHASDAIWVANGSTPGGGYWGTPGQSGGGGFFDSVMSGIGNGLTGTVSSVGNAVGPYIPAAIGLTAGYGALGAAGLLGGATAPAAVTATNPALIDSAMGTAGYGASAAGGALNGAGAGIGAAGGAAMGTAGAAGAAGVGAGAANMATTAGVLGTLKDYAPLIGAVAGAAGSGNSSTSTSATKDPWAPAQAWMRANLGFGQDLQNKYAANPFSQFQRQAYNNSANLGNQFRGAVNGLVPQMNNWRPYQRTPQSQTVAPLNFGTSNLGLTSSPFAGA